jgi:anthranilate 1,2-dioxygenase small subunit
VATSTVAREVLAREALQDLVCDLALCIDDGPHERIAQFFTEDTLYLVIPRREYDLGRKVGFMRCESRGMLEDRLAAMKNGNIFEPHQYRHVVSNVFVDGISEGVVRMRTPFILVRTAQDGIGQIFASGKYLDEVVTRDERLQIRKRIVVLDSHRIDTLLVLPI